MFSKFIHIVMSLHLYPLPEFLDGKVIISKEEPAITEPVFDSAIAEELISIVLENQTEEPVAIVLENHLTSEPLALVFEEKPEETISIVLASNVVQEDSRWNFWTAQEEPPCPPPPPPPPTPPQVSIPTYPAYNRSPVPVTFVEYLPTYAHSTPRASSSYGSWLAPKRLTFIYADGTERGLCFPTQYVSGQALFAPDYCLCQVMPMLDLRGYYLNRDLFAIDVGIGGRFIPDGCSFCEILGLNAYYDYRQGFLGNYSLVGVGMEILNNCWELRLNATFPVGKREHVNTFFFDDYIGDFFFIRQRKEFVLNNVNAELGYYIYKKCDWFVYLGGGPYMWYHPCFHARGGRIRIRPQYRDYLALDLSVSYDEFYKTVYQAQLILSLPLYQYRCLNKSSCLTDRQIYQPIERFDLMPLGRRTCFDSNF